MNLSNQVEGGDDNLTIFGCTFDYNRFLFKDHTFVPLLPLSFDKDY